MTLENLTIDFLKENFKKVNTNGTFNMWAIRFISKTFNLDVNNALFIFKAIQ